MQGSHRCSEEQARYETRALLALSTIPGWGYWTIKRLATAGISLHELLHLPDTSTLHAALTTNGIKQRPDATDPWPLVAERAWKAGASLHQRLASSGIKVILRGTPEFPKTLDELRDPPQWLFVRGDVALLSARSLAIVGTRSPSAEGLHLCWYLGESLSLFGAPTISGLASGIDQQVHKASINAGVPTVAVLGNGIFREYPAGSTKLADDIVLAGGAIVTEYFPDQIYSKENFVRRNRIQAGLARALIPVEWKFPSGTAHTIGFAQELGRPLIAIRARTAYPDARPELLEFQKRGGNLFAIPGEEKSFLEFVGRALAGDVTPTAPHSDVPLNSQLELI